jgi:2-polyprenyl-3-methyl-5-hydroxy-6-metoxy-1,4-benzoquinol methylase
MTQKAMVEDRRHKYEYEVDLNSDSAPAYVTKMVGKNKRVLEIGSGPGSVTKLLQSAGNCRVTAVELDGEAIKKVAPYCDTIIKADLNSTDWPQLLTDAGRFDAVVAADVLEHLYDPWSTLQRMVSFLKPRGYLVISLPHAGHASVMSCLINGDFEYREFGLLDRTHIRFFGLKNIEALFAQASLKIIEARYVIKQPEETEFASGWTRLPYPVRDVILSTPHSRIYQVVVKAVPLGYPGEAVPLVASEPEFRKRVPAAPVGISKYAANAEQEALTSAPCSQKPQEDAYPLETTQSLKDHLTPRLIAFYLPQFHPTPENDQWWGKGFTEWTNVTKAEPLFEGHLQPHLPTDSGFYDLRLREARYEQIKMAKRYGIDAFCYHYYWFSGKRILNRPLDDMLADPESDMPFCLCWANENWTRRWDGADHEILIAQEYLADDDLNLIKSLAPFFQDKRYIRVNGKPFFIVYRAQQFPDPSKTAAIWRDYCRSIGLGEIHICGALTHGNEDSVPAGFDSGIEFPPHNPRVGNINDQAEFYEPFAGNLMQYSTIAQSYLDRSYGNTQVFKTVFPSWDNTARTKERALVVLNGTPENYEHWLASTIDLVRQNGRTDELVFINAWNEWAEGCHLEPDRWFGHGFLQATQNAKSGIRRFTAFPHLSVPPVKVAQVEPRLAFWQEISSAIKYHLPLKISELRLAVNQRPWLRFLLLPFVRTARTLRVRI